MGHIYCYKAAGVSAEMTLSATLLALPLGGLILPDSFIAHFYGNGLHSGLAF